MTAAPTAADPIPPQKRRFLSGAGFPAFLITGALCYEAFLIAVIFGPGGSGAWGQFSEDFKVWCFSYDPRTGGMSWASVWVMLLEPIFLAAVGAFLWRHTLKDFLSWRKALACWKEVALGAGFATAAAVALFVYGNNKDAAAAEALPPFPGERIRTQIQPPAFELTDQRGAPVNLESLKGRVVIVTGVYAQCSTACPQILREIKNLADALPPDLRSRLSVVALSLNPEYDSRLLMDTVARAYGFDYPMFRYANGDPSVMHDLLTRFQFSPIRNETTGMIDHANLFILVDAGGVIAYRFGLSDRHLPWLHQATTDLLREAAPPALAEAPGS
jgi:protein SCO1/2